MLSKCRIAIYLNTKIDGLTSVHKSFEIIMLQTAHLLLSLMAQYQTKHFLIKIDQKVQPSNEEYKDYMGKFYSGLPPTKSMRGLFLN